MSNVKSKLGILSIECKKIKNKKNHLKNFDAQYHQKKIICQKKLYQNLSNF
jgi:hypothetical protein